MDFIGAIIVLKFVINVNNFEGFGIQCEFEREDWTCSNCTEPNEDGTPGDTPPYIVAGM